jgi:hypothetical protein
MMSVVVSMVISSLLLWRYHLFIYHTADTLSRLSQKQQLFCSAFMSEPVIIFTTEIGAYAFCQKITAVFEQ